MGEFRKLVEAEDEAPGGPMWRPAVNEVKPLETRLGLKKNQLPHPPARPREVDGGAPLRSLPDAHGTAKRQEPARRHAARSTWAKVPPTARTVGLPAELHGAARVLEDRSRPKGESVRRRKRNVEPGRARDARLVQGTRWPSTSSTRRARRCSSGSLRRAERGGRETSPPAPLDRLGLGWEVLRAADARLVFGTGARASA